MPFSHSAPTVSLLVALLALNAGCSGSKSSPAERAPQREPKLVSGPRPLNLLQNFQPDARSKSNQWKMENGALIAPFSMKPAIWRIPVVVPQDEYSIHIDLTRSAGRNMFGVGLVAAGTQFVAALDAGDGRKHCGLELVDGKPIGENPTTKPGKVLNTSEQVALIVTVRKNAVAVMRNGRVIVRWKGDFARLSLADHYPAGVKDSLFLVSKVSSFRIHRLTLTDAVDIPDKDELPTDVHQLAKMTIELPPEPKVEVVKNSPRLVAEAFAEAAAVRHDSSKLKLRLLALRPYIQKVGVSTLDKELPWQTLTLNRRGQGFDAIRISSPYKELADMRWAFAALSEKRASWFIIPSRGEMRGFRNFHRRRNLQVDNLELPGENEVVFQRLLKQMHPETEYFVWFTFVDENPVEFHFKIKIVPSRYRPGGRPPPRASFASTIISQLGIRTSRFSGAGSDDGEQYFNNARKAVAGGDMEAALLAIDEFLEFDPENREGLFFAIQVSLARARQATENLGRKAGIEFLVRGATYGRRLRMAQKNLTQDERALLATALFRAASAEAFAGRSADALETLQEAVAAGFTDIVALENDLGFKALQDQAAFMSIKQRVQSLNQSQLRDWVDRSGRFKVRGKLADVAAGSVTLLSESGALFSIAVDRLTAEDQEIIRVWKQRRDARKTNSDQNKDDK